MGALGYVLQVPEEEKFLNTKKELEARLVVSLGGRAAEEIVFDTVTTGAANDIEQATAIARAMITQYGMSEKFGLMGLATQQNQYLDGRMVLNCGDQTATEVDHEVMALLKKSYEEALSLLRAHRETMDRIAEHLIESETITGKEFMKIFRECEGEADPADEAEAEYEVPENAADDEAVSPAEEAGAQYEVPENAADNEAASPAEEAGAQYEVPENTADNEAVSPADGAETQNAAPEIK